MGFENMKNPILQPATCPHYVWSVSWLYLLVLPIDFWSNTENLCPTYVGYVLGTSPCPTHLIWIQA